MMYLTKIDGERNMARFYMVGSQLSSANGAGLEGPGKAAAPSSRRKRRSAAS